MLYPIELRAHEAKALKTSLSDPPSDAPASFICLLQNNWAASHDKYKGGRVESISKTRDAV